MSEPRSTSILTAARDQIPLESVLVSIDLDDDIAYVAYEGEASIRWDELSRADGEFLARLGRPLRSNSVPSRGWVGSALAVAGRSA